MSIEVFSLEEVVIVHVVQVAVVLLKTFMPPVEYVVDVRVTDSTLPKLIAAKRKVWNNKLCALPAALMMARLFVSGSKPTIHSVPVGPPHILESIIDVLVVGASHQVRRQKHYQRNVLNLDTEDGCSK